LRTLYAFDPLRTAVLLIGGTKPGDNRWYETFVPAADRLYARTSAREETVMPTRKFQELLDKMPTESRREVALRVKQTLEGMPLEELRRARQMSQTKLAESWGVTQSEVSKIEHRTDAYISTLAEYIEALGGRLEIMAIFPDREMRISQFEEIPK
jgi:DNA-binding transcriptional regulator YiaG